MVARALCALTLVIAGLGAPAASAQTVIGYPGFANLSGLQLNGSAARSATVLELTPASPNQQGSAFATTPVDPRQSFSTGFGLNFPAGSFPPADGMAFVLQSVGPTAVSASGLGSALGYGGIHPSVAVEFDLFNGDPGDPGYVSSGAVDAGDQHVGITVNGDPTSHFACATVRSPPDSPCTGTLPGPLSGPVFAWVDYSSAAHVLSVYVAKTRTKPAAPVVSRAIDLAGLLGPSTFAGFTAATGLFTAEQDVTAWGLGALVTPPPPVDSDQDGVPDPADRCPKQVRGRYDRDHDGCPGPYRRMHVDVAETWAIPVRGVRVTLVQLRNVPAKGKVVLTCRRCHLREARRTAAGHAAAKLKLRRIARHTLAAGTSFVVEVTAPGYIGVVYRFVVRKHGPTTAERLRANERPFRRTTLCLTPGAKHAPQRCPR